MAHVSQRLSATAGAGRVARSPVARLLSVLDSDESLAAYNGWAEHPMGRLIISALRHMAQHAPDRLPDAAIPVQYGLTLGLSLAADLLTDPSSVFADVARPGSTIDDAFTPAYSVAPDEVVDQSDTGV